MAKKVKETKNVAGTDIVNISGYNTWITCTTEDGEKFSINFKMLYTLLDKYEFNLEKYGERFRAVEFYQRGED